MPLLHNARNAGLARGLTQGLATHGQCCACGVSIPLCEPIFEKLGRCYSCGRFNPVGPRLGRLLTPVCLILALAALTMWWGQSPL